MRLGMLNAPNALQRERNIQSAITFLKRDVLPYNPNLTFGDIVTVLNNGKMNGWLSDIGSAINGTIRSASSSLGEAGLGTTLTSFLDSVGHGTENTLATDATTAAQNSILDALGSFGQDIRTGHVVNSIFTPVGILIMAVVAYFLFIRK